MVAKSEKRSAHDEALLAWDKEKHNVYARFKLRKHVESMVAQDRMTFEILEALKDISNGFHFFAGKMAKRM